MKKILITFIIIITPILAIAQTKDYNDIFEEYTNGEYYTVDGNNIIVSMVIEDIDASKDDIYIRVRDFFTRTYNDANSVIQLDDKEKGVVVGKGIYSNYWGYKVLLTSIVFSANHTIRVDIKENRVRVICSSNTISSYNAMKPLRVYKYLVVEYEPFTEKRKLDKGKQTQAFIHLVEQMHNSVDILRKTLQESSLKIENDEW